MANMSYCRFENTSNDLRDCYEALVNGEAEDDELSSDYERAGKQRLIKLCHQIVEEFGNDNQDESD